MRNHKSEIFNLPVGLTDLGYVVLDEDLNILSPFTTTGVIESIEGISGNYSVDIEIPDEFTRVFWYSNDGSDFEGEESVPPERSFAIFDVMAETMETVLLKLQEVSPGSDPVVIFPPPIAISGMSALYLDIVDDGLPVDGIEVTAKLLGARPISIGNAYEAALTTVVKTGKITTGRAIFNTYPGKKYRIISEFLGLDKTVTAPEAGISRDIASATD